MANTFDAQSTYNKFQGDCNCEGDCSCGKKEQCGCCPPGLVALLDDCGKHIACVTPNDAAVYKITKHIPATGYIKLFNPTTGDYLGDLTPSQALEIMAAINPAIAPPVALGQFNPYFSDDSISLAAPADDATSQVALAFSVDRVSCTGGIVVQFSSGTPAGFSFLGGATSLLIGENNSVILDGILIDDQVDAGTYEISIAFSGCANTITKVLTVIVS